MENTQELYSPRDIARLKRKNNIEKVVVWLIAAAVLAVCVLLCVNTTTANAVRMEYSTIAVFTVAGWVDLYLLRFAVAYGRHEIQHAEMLRAGEREELRGVLAVTKERLRIRNSVSIRIVTLEQDGQARRLKVIESRVRQLERLAGRETALYVANGYVAACREL